MPKVVSTDADKEILRNILACVNELDPKSKAGKLQSLITKKKMLRSNTSELSSVIDILGIAGILSSEQAPCYADKFVDQYSRTPPELTNDRAYPVNTWKASDGINKARYQIVFGEEYD